MSKYVIIDEEAIQKEIEELKKQYDRKSKVNDNQWCSIISGQILALERILSKSTPLIPEIEKAWEDGRNGTGVVGNFPFVETKYVNKTSQDYISNLKLDK